LAFFERILKNNNGGQGFLVGNDVSHDQLSCSSINAALQITFADFWIYYTFFIALSADPDAATEFPLLNGLYQRIGTRPGIAHWVKVRPVSEF